ncbi:hypothetical protein CDAR_375511 [Caerostris darwini]|uniref:Maturase K n=1 Tax=Caerostris darwini TaxID=1538125 RepID=A0AAV4S3G7_9ARAC|nr:hypothetical protein CDAR_375511 [Caerostris darwini]
MGKEGENGKEGDGEAQSSKAGIYPRPVIRPSSLSFARDFSLNFTEVYTHTSALTERNISALPIAVTALVDTFCIDSPGHNEKKWGDFFKYPFYRFHVFDSFDSIRQSSIAFESKLLRNIGSHVLLGVRKLNNSEGCYRHVLRQIIRQMYCGL